jgi:hypothetical protein
MNDNISPELIEKLTQIAKGLGFSDENCQKIANELYLSIIDETYSCILDAVSFTDLVEKLKNSDIEGVKSITSQVNSHTFIANLQKATENVISEFLKSIIDRCPEGFLDELEKRIEAVRLEFLQAQV